MPIHTVVTIPTPSIVFYNTTPEVPLSLPFVFLMFINFAILAVILILAVFICVYDYRRNSSIVDAFLWFIVALFFPIGPILYYLLLRRNNRGHA